MSAQEKERSSVGLVLHGRCWKLGDDVSSDALISARHVYEYDPRQLRRHLLAELRPEFAAEAKPGDIVVAGRRFAHGSQHSHPFLAMQAIGVGLLGARLMRAPYRLAVYMGVPLLDVDEETVAALQDGDRLRVDFVQGRIDDETTGRRFDVAPLPAFLLDIVQAGGGLEFLRTEASARGEPDR